MFDVLPATVGHFVCKIADTQLVYDFSALNRGPNPVHVIFSFFFNIPLYARVGNLQPFACIHKWTILVCNVVLGLMVECRHMFSVDGAYNLTYIHTHTYNARLVMVWMTFWKYFTSHGLVHTHTQTNQQTYTQHTNTQPPHTNIQTQHCRYLGKRI